MKTLKFLAMMLMMATMVFNLSSCKDDEDEKEDLIIGTWKCTKVTAYYNGKTETWSGEDECAYMTFQKKGKGYYSEYVGDNDPFYFEYMVSGKTLSIVEEDGDTFSYQIETLTKTEMVLYDNSFDEEYREYYVKVD